MWLAEDGGGSGSGTGTLPSSSGHGSEPGSPPLEAGEALSELIVVDSDTVADDKPEVKLLTNLASILESSDNRNGTTTTERFQDVFPVIQEALPSAQPEVQLVASNSFLTILEKELVPHTTFTETFLQSILASVDNRDPVVANAWIETLLDVIDLLPKDVVKQNILSMAVAKGQMSQPVTSRLSCCRMLGKICGKFEPYLIKKEILPVVHSLCQDVDHEVRGCMCRELDSVARGLGLEATKSAILPELVELANDEDSYVRLAGIETVVNMLSLLDDETCTQIIVPLVRNICDNCIKSQDLTLLVVAKQLGKLCHGLSVNLTVEQKAWFLEFYREVARLGLSYHREDGNSNTMQHPMPDIVPQFDDHDKYTECRHCCAYNFPAMVLFAGPNDFEDQLYNTFHDLARDPYAKVRRTIACGVHEVAKLLGPCVYWIQREIICLLQDDSLEVLKGIITHLPITLEALAKEGTMGSELKFYDCDDDVMTAVVQCEQNISRTSDWRINRELIDKLSCLPKCLSSNKIFQRFTPLLFRKLFTARPIPCRVAAASTLLVFLRSNPRQDQRQEICYRLIQELGCGRSCHNRMLFITVCELILNNFSHTFFKQNFFLPLLDLCGDPVANVRLKLCSVIPRLKTVLRLPSDKHLLQELETCVGKLLIDEEDRDGSAAVRKAILELDKIEVAVETAGTTAPRRSQSADSDRDDHIRDDEDYQYYAQECVNSISPESVMFPTATTTTTKKPVQSAGKIPIRRNLDGSPEMRRSSTIGSSLVTLHLTSASPTNDRAGSSSGFSRIPTLQNKTLTAKDTPIPTRRQIVSPSRLKPAVPPRTSVGSPLPSPESMRRAFQAHSVSSVPSESASRRKSLGPGTIVTFLTTPRNPRPASIISHKMVSSSSSPSHQSHIPRYLSSTLLTDEDEPSSDAPPSRSLPPSRLRLLSLPNCSPLVLSSSTSTSSSPATSCTTSPSSPSISTNSTGTKNNNNNNNSPLDDYDLELLKLVDEGEESPRCVSPHPDIMLALATAAHRNRSDGPSSRLPIPSSARGGGSKMYAHFASSGRSHVGPRCATPPPSAVIVAAGNRACRSATSSPTHALRSFIPRYVGSNHIPPLHLLRGRRGTSRAISLPVSPHSISPTRSHVLTLPSSRIPRTASPRSHSFVKSCPNRDGTPIPPRAASGSSSSAAAAAAAAESKDVCTSRSVRNLVRQLESLSDNSKTKKSLKSSK